MKTGSFGGLVSCGDSGDDHVQGICGTGGNNSHKDCENNSVNIVYCRDTSTHIRINYAGCYWQTGSHGSQKSCGTGEVMINYCGSGSQQDCSKPPGFGGGKTSTKAQCCPIIWKNHLGQIVT